jgi:hypothetical protein
MANALSALRTDRGRIREKILLAEIKKLFPVHGILAFVSFRPFYRANDVPVSSNPKESVYRVSETRNFHPPHDP